MGTNVRNTAIVGAGALQAAFGLAQLERIDEPIAQKRRIFEAGYWLITVMLSPDLGIRKEAVIDALAAEQIDSRPFFNPLSELPAYDGRGGSEIWRRRNPASYALSPLGVNLPSALNLIEAGVIRVCDALKRIAKLPAAASTP